MRRGIDIETLHVDVPPDMPLFEGATAEARRRAARGSGDADSDARGADEAASSSGSATTVRDVLARPRVNCSVVLAYLPIYIAAILEGEIYYSKVCADAISGRLFWPAVLACGALGGATGDQFWFYLLRGRIHWLDRYPKLAKYRDRGDRRVTRARNRTGAGQPVSAGPAHRDSGGVRLRRRATR